MRSWIAAVCIVLLSCAAGAQQVSSAPASAANTDPAYQQLRHIQLGDGLFSVKDFVLKRDAGKFVFRSGIFSFLKPVNGKVTGAVFVGDGSFSIAPPLETENKMLALLTKQPEYVEHFDRLVLRFTDDTDADIRAGCAVAQGSDGGASVALGNL